MKRLIFIRHAESEYNLKRNSDHPLIFNDFDIQLTENGCKQAKNCGIILEKDVLNSTSVDYCVFVSPYLRARDTWKIASENISKKPANVIEDVRLREMEFHNFEEGVDPRTRKNYKSEIGDLLYRYPNGESGADVFNRISNFYNQIRMDFLLKNLPDTVIIFSHGFVIRCFISLIENKDHASFNKIFIKNCEIVNFYSDSDLVFKRNEF